MTDIKDSSYEMYNEFKSSNIKTLWYSKDKQELIVEFLNGSQYRYSNVSELEWQNLKSAESKGKFLNENIKSKPYQKMILKD
ncbi:MAG TPA: KTSC domain-containing protein [bacterium]|jgi:hypothetical protein|nr:KTSC domain-containing protein [bacterium]